MFCGGKINPFVGSKKNLNSLKHSPETAAHIACLWHKYSDELKHVSSEMAVLFNNMRLNNYGAIFGDIEGELLYILVREIKPNIIFEISPNTGYSTNYMLSAMTRNGVGVMESFELESSFNGRPTEEVIRSNMIPSCDPTRHRINIGDARVEAFKALERGAPDFTLIDSCHDDFFAEFYIKALFPQIKGTVVVQDALHFDPRPEWAPEAYYLLSWLYETSSPYLPFPLYEDGLRDLPARAGLTPRRPLRGSSIVLDLGDAPAAKDDLNVKSFLSVLTGTPDDASRVRFPLNWLPRRTPGQPLALDFNDPANRYVAAVFGGRVDDATPGFIDLLAAGQMRRRMSDAMAAAAVDRFADYDAMLQGLALEAFANQGRLHELRCVLAHDFPVKGVYWSGRLAQAAADIGDHAAMRRWLERLLVEGEDMSQALGYRALLAGAGLAEKTGEQALAERLFDAALVFQRWRTKTFADGPTSKIFREIALFCASHPAFAARASAMEKLDATQH